MFLRIACLIAFTLCVLVGLHIVDLGISSDYGAGIGHFAFVSMATISAAIFAVFLVTNKLYLEPTNGVEYGCKYSFRVGLFAL